MAKINEKDRKLLEAIFICGKPNNMEFEEPQSWKDWKSGKSNYKPFRLQFIECGKNGTRYYEKCKECGRTSIICKKYGGRCHSGKCRDERIKGD